MVKRFGHDGMTRTGQLDKIGNDLFSNRYIGTFPQDDLPNKIYDKDKALYAIINTDLRGSPGEHWIAIAGLPHSTKIMVFDSFGRAAKILLPTLRQKNVINTESDAEQKAIQESCGQFSMAWLLFLDQYGYDNAKLI